MIAPVHATDDRTGTTAATGAVARVKEVVKQVRTACPYCGVGCGMTLHVEGDRVVKISGDAAHPANRGRLCTKGLTAHVALHDAGRLQRA